MAVFSGIGAAIGGFFSSITAGTVGSFLLNTAASLALSAVANKIARNRADTPSFSVRVQMSRGANIPQSFIVGKFATAGTLTYNRTRPGHSPNAALFWATTLSDLPITGVSAVWVNGVKRSLIAAGATGTGASGYQAVTGFQSSPGAPGGASGNFLEVRVYDGTQTNADGFLLNTDPGRLWTSTAIGTGTAYAVVYAYISEEYFRNGVPNVLFEVEGIPLYDISKDSTAGGTGAHRWNDPTTWESSENPAVIIYNLLRGIYHDGQWFYGLQGVSEAQLPAAHWIAEIEACDELVDADGGQEPRYRASGEIPVTAEVFSAIQKFLDACNGRLSDAGGVYKLFVGRPRTAVATFSDDDIISTSEQSFTPFYGLAESVNGIAATYPSPAAGWQVETAPPLYSSDFEVEDGGRRLLADVSFDVVPYPEQVQRLMKAALSEARRARRHTITLPPSFWALEPGDVVEWTSARNGYATKQFRVDGVIDLPGADVILDLTEIDPADYDFDTDTDFTAPADPGVLAEDIPSQAVPGFTVTATAIKDADGNDRRPAIRAEWDTVDSDVKAVKFQTRVKATEILVSTTSCDTPSDESDIISEGIIHATTYQVRAQFVVRPTRPVEWTSWQDVTTAAVRLSSDDLNSTINTQLAAADTALADLEALTEDFVGNLKDAFDGEEIARGAAIATSEATLRAEFNSAASFLSVRDFADGSGDFSPADHTIVTSTTPAMPSGVTHALRLDDEVCADGTLRADPGMANRVLEWTGWVLAEDSSYDAEVGIRTRRTDGTTNDYTTVKVADAGQVGWVQFKANLTLPSDVGEWLPRLESSDTTNDPSQDIYFANLDLRDVSGVSEAITTSKAYTDQEVLALSGPGGAITAISDQLGVEVTQLRGESDGFNVVLDSLDVLFENNSATLAGAAAVGQADTIIVTESAGTRVTSGNTNGGAVIQIAEEKARQFSGRRVKISILAKEPSSNPATRFGIAYSTADAGNSGYVQADADLESSFEWFYFFYDVPTAGNGGPDYLAIFGDDDQNGDGTQIARVNIQIAAEADDMPEIATLQGDIVDIKGLSASGLTGTVFGTFLQEMNVAADGTVAGVTNFGSAMADLDGNASAALVMRTKAGGAAGEIEIVSFDNADGGAAYSQVSMSADTILLSGASVLIGDYRNMLFGSTGTWANHGWNLTTGASIETWAWAKSGGKVLLLTSAHTQSYFSKEYDVQEGDEFRLHFWARPATNVVDQTNGVNRVHIETQDETGAWTHQASENWEADTLGVWTEHENDFVIDNPGAVRMRVSIDTGHTAGDVRLDDIRLEKKSGMELVVSGGLRSDNFSTGVSGWQIDRAGNAEFNQLITRNSLVSGSVSDRQDNYRAVPPQETYELPAIPTDGAMVFVCGVTELSQSQVNTGTVTVIIQARVFNGTWTSWETVASGSVISPTFGAVPLDAGGIYVGQGTQVQFRILNSHSASNTDLSITQQYFEAWGVAV